MYRRRPNCDFSGERGRRNVHWDETIFYETHVKGFTQLRQDIPEHLRGTYAGLVEKPVIDYIKALGVTSVELLPIHTFVNDRVGYGTTAFNAISLNVNHGVATLCGTAYGPVDKDYALVDASYMLGVEGVVDNIQVYPVSIFDDRIRLATARAVYGYLMLNKYAIDPAKPIRIVVQNGNVTLLGVVITKADKEVAGLRANSVPGVFKVTNKL